MEHNSPSDYLKELEDRVAKYGDTYVGLIGLSVSLRGPKGYFHDDSTARIIFHDEQAIAAYVDQLRLGGMKINGYRIHYKFFADKDVSL